MGEDMTINYTYTEFGKQMMILDIGAPVSLAGIPWMTQYLQEVGLTIKQLSSVKCCQPPHSVITFHLVSSNIIVPSN